MRSLAKVFCWGVALVAVVAGAAPVVLAESAEFQLEIERPASDRVVSSQQAEVEVRGRAEIRGGLRNLDLFLVLDTSKSLRKTDPNDHRAAGAVGLVRSLMWSDIQIGVVDFDRKTRVVSPLTGDLSAVMQAIRDLDQNGASDFARGIRLGLEGLARGGRPGAGRLMLVFSDGKLEPIAVRKALGEAREQGVSISTLAFGADADGEELLRELAYGTGGSFVAVTDPGQLPEAFLNLRTTGVERVEVRVNDTAPMTARLVGREFSVRVPLVPGENLVVARAIGFDGREREETVRVRVRSPGCAVFELRAERSGKPALSISKRAVEIVVDASGSMWGQMEGRTKIEIAKQILSGALAWLPIDVQLSLRAYGHQHGREQRDCEDTQLLVAPREGNRDEIRSAVVGLQPKGQTPLAFALTQVAADFGRFHGERAVVLVTDGLESCGQDPVSAARALQQHGPIPVHVIGFGLGNESDTDLASLRGIAEVSGGKFLRAGNAAELRRALGTTVGTPYRVWRGDTAVAEGVLGSGEPIRLPAGGYRVELESAPPHALPVSLVSEESLTLVLQRESDQIVHSVEREAAEYAACEEGDAEVLLSEEEPASSSGVRARGRPVPASAASAATGAP